MPLLDYRNPRDDIEPLGINTVVNLLHWLSRVLLWIGALVGGTAFFVCLAWVVLNRNANPDELLLGSVFLCLAVLSVTVRLIKRNIDARADVSRVTAKRIQR